MWLCSLSILLFYFTSIVTAVRFAIVDFKEMNEWMNELYTSIDPCAISYAAPQMLYPWISANSPSVGSFKRNFKTFYFAAAY